MQHAVLILIYFDAGLNQVGVIASARPDDDAAVGSRRDHQPHADAAHRRRRQGQDHRHVGHEVGRDDQNGPAGRRHGRQK